MFYPEHIREIPTDLSSAALPSPVLKQVPSIQDLPVDVGTSAGVSMGKEIPPLASDTPSEDALTIRDVISQAKVAKKPKARDAKSKTANTEEDPQATKKYL